MTDAELDRLADLIARALLDQRAPTPTTNAPAAPWVLAPIRPAPPERTGNPPVWSGAAQSLDDVAPGKTGQEPPRYRVSTGEMTRATRAAAAGKGAAPQRADREPSGA